MLNLASILVFKIAISVIKFAILLFILLLILQTITWSRKSKKRVFPILTTLKIRTIIIVIIGISIITSILVLGIISISAKAEIKSLIENLKNCDAIAVENSLMRVKGDPLENSIIQDRKKIQDLVRLLSEVEYKRSIYIGPMETRDLVDIHIVSRDIKKPHSFRVFSHLLLIGNFPKFTEYVSSGESLKGSVRQVLGISDLVYPAIDPNEKKFHIPIGEREVWIGTKKEWESRPKKDK